MEYFVVFDPCLGTESMVFGKAWCQVERGYVAGWTKRNGKLRLVPEQGAGIRIGSFPGFCGQSLCFRPMLGTQKADLPVWDVEAARNAKLMQTSRVVKPAPTKGAHFDIRGSGPTKTLYGPVAVNHVSVEVLNAMGDASRASVVDANRGGVSVECDPVFIGHTD